MNLNRLKEYLALTKREKQIILFLFVTLVIGLVLRYYQINIALPPTYDYSEEDSLFTVLSKSRAKDGVSSKGDEKLNVNTATKEELQRIEGIGEKLAERIIQYRTKYGFFRRIDELMRIPGIGKRKFDQISNYLTVH
jgi:competence ComEA-like helix-hairpin-helix protein